MKKYIIVRKQFGGNNFLKIREDKNGNNLKNLKECKKETEYIKIGSGFQANIYMIQKKCGTLIIKEYLKEKINEMKRELNGLIKVKELIRKNICPHYIYMYDYNLKEGKIYLEFVEGDIKKIYKNFTLKLSDNFVYSFYFQMLYAIQCEYDFCNLLHHDLLPNNILKKTIDDDKIFVYNINGIKYYIPTYGNLFIIADYGRSVINNQKKNWDYEDFMTGIISLFAKQLILQGYDTTNKLFKLVNKEVLEKNNIDITRKIRYIITECIKKRLFNYKPFFDNHNIIDITLKILDYKNIIEVFENLYGNYREKILSNNINYFEKVIFKI